MVFIGKRVIVFVKRCRLGGDIFFILLDYNEVTNKEYLKKAIIRLRRN